MKKIVDYETSYFPIFKQEILSSVVKKYALFKNEKKISFKLKHNNITCTVIEFKKGWKTTIIQRCQTSKKKGQN